MFIQTKKVSGAKDSDVATTAPVWQALTLGGAYTYHTSGGVRPPTQYTSVEYGSVKLVMLRGILKIADGSRFSTSGNFQIATLPEGYRPSYLHTFVCVGHQERQMCHVQVQSDGGVVLISGGSQHDSQATWRISLDQIRFFTN